MGKQMAREAVGAPARRAGAVVARLFAYGLALTLLYVALAHPDVIRAAARAPGIALRWMSNPSASIPYAL